MLSDNAIAHKVTVRWRRASGASITTDPALGMIERLLLVFGEDFTMDGAIEALDALSQTCDSLKRDLIKERSQ